MRVEIVRLDGSVEHFEGSAECGRDFCDTCGDCLECEPHGASGWCESGGRLVLYEDQDGDAKRIAELRSAHVSDTGSHLK